MSSTKKRLFNRSRGRPVSGAPAFDGSIEALARRCFERTTDPAEHPPRQFSPTPRQIVVGAGSGAALGWLVGLSPELEGGFLAVIIGAFVGGLVGAIFADLGLFDAVARSHGTGRGRGLWKAVEDGVTAYRDGVPWAVMEVHEFAVAEFRERVATHRARTLGADSEWGQARASLVDAGHEAQRSAAYWRERLRAEPGSELAQAQGRVADRLEAKLGEALGKLDARAAALRKFYNDCEARLAVMARRNQDLEESRRLEELSDRADVIIDHAEGVVQSIATAFVAEAHAMSEALGGVAKVGIKSLAGEAPIENIEFLADRIIEDSDRERAAVEDLDRNLMRASR